MSARLHTRQRYRRAIPEHEYKGFKIRVYRSKKNRFSAQFIGPDKIPRRFEKGSELDAVDAAKECIKTFGDVALQQALLEEKAVSELLAPLGISMIEAARLIVTSATRLRPFEVGIPQAIDYYVTRHAAKPIKVKDLVEELITIKTRDTGVHNKKDLISKLRNGFNKKFGDRLIGSIVSSELTIYVNSYPGSKRTRRNQHSALVTLFEYAKENGYLSKGVPTEMDSVTKPKAGNPTKNIYTPADLKALIAAGLSIRSRALAALLIQTMAGLRTEELRQTDPKKDRLRWSDVWLNQLIPEIHVRENVAKNGIERFVPIPPALVKWLRLLRLPGDEPIFHAFNIYWDYRKIAEKAGLTWKKNAPRKSFNTYDAALRGSFRLTSKAAGNSPAVIHRYYNKAVSQVGLVGEKWFSLAPNQFTKTALKHIVQINATSRKLRFSNQAQQTQQTASICPHNPVTNQPKS